MARDKRISLATAATRFHGRDAELDAEVEEKLKRHENVAAAKLELPSVGNWSLSTILQPQLQDEAMKLSIDSALYQRYGQRKVQESIVNAHYRPVFVIRNNQVVPEFIGPDSEIWKTRIMEQAAVLNSVIPSVGRVEVLNNAVYQWCGTGWVIDNEVIVTNRHVASIFCQNRSGFRFKVGYPSGLQSSRLDFLEEDQRIESLEFNVDSVLWMSENRNDQPDVAFLRISRQTNSRPLPPAIILGDECQEGEVVVAIGYPARDSDIPDQDLVMRIFQGVYDKKRLAPGEIRKASKSEIEHDCSTLGGNSGSALVQLSTGKAVGLHFAGLYMEANFAVASPVLADLLDKLRRGTLQGMRAIELSGSNETQTSVSLAPAVSTPSIVSPTGSNTYTLQGNIPIKITVEIGAPAFTSSPTTTQPAVAPPSNVTSGDNVQAALDAARQALQGQSGVLNIYLGYRFYRGWITDEKVIVVEVKDKKNYPDLKSANEKLIPAHFLGIGTDVRTAALAQQLEAQGISLEALEAPTQPGVYREPPDLSLDKIDEPMQAIFHVSPDSGFPNLKSFIERVDESLTATMYEWEPNHISEALYDRINSGDRTLTMVSERKGTRTAVEDLGPRLGEKFRHIWASVGAGKIVPRAYHIKVATRDRQEFWLSSGNWKESNQADIDPAGEDSTLITPLRQHNREWHVIIQHAGLAGLFEDYIKWDFEEAGRVPLEETPEPIMPDVFVPEEMFNVSEERRAVAQYFDPLILNRRLHVQPLLTPDRNSQTGSRMFIDHATQLIEAATQTIHLENQSFNLLDDNVEAFERFFSVLKNKQESGIELKIIFRDAREFGSANGPSQQRLLERIKDFGIDTDLIKVQRKCHTKAIIVDHADDERAAVLFGSHNLTNAGALYNRDASLIVRDGEVARYFEQIFDFDWEVLATQSVEEVAGVTIAPPNQPTPTGYRRVSLTDLLGIN